LGRIDLPSCMVMVCNYILIHKFMKNIILPNDDELCFYAS
jgi:hypothetical protein